jgi:lysyl-tRNA synthetase class 2
MEQSMTDGPSSSRQAEPGGTCQTATSTRRARLDALRELGINPYPNHFRPGHRLAGVLAQYDHPNQYDAEALSQVAIQAAGRIMLLRSFGKLTFAHLQDESGRMQIAVQRDEVGEEIYRTQFQSSRSGVEVGDILGVEGYLFRTKTGELTIRVQQFTLLSKSLRPLPEKWHGLGDVETRYRQRYVDLIVNPDVRALFRTRSHIIRLIRTFMESSGFLEVETPMMQPIPGGATARPFVTHHNALDMDLYLRIAPELYLKRLIVGGFERVFEINRNFRNEGLSVRHNPEFTMMEFYQAYADYQILMDFVEALIVHVVREVHGGLVIPHREQTLDFTPPWSRLTLAGSLVHIAGLDAGQLAQRDGLLAYARQHLRRPAQTVAGGVADEFDAVDDGHLLLELFEKLVEPKLISPTFIMDYPVSVSPLSRRSDTRPEVAERFELFIGGWEIANAFSELNDPVDQAGRFRDQVAAKAAGDVEAMYYDADYIRALEYGMPPTGGAGIGIDRLVMLLTNATSIRDVLLFPQMRPELAHPAGAGE